MRDDISELVSKTGSWSSCVSTMTATSKVKCLVHMPDKAFTIAHHFSDEGKVGRDIILQTQPWPVTLSTPSFV